MMRRSLALPMLLLAAASIAACSDDGGLSPVRLEDVQGTWVLSPPTDGPTQSADTVRLWPQGFGEWTTTWLNTMGITTPPPVYRAFSYELKGALLRLKEPPPCPPFAFCIRNDFASPMTGLVRGDTLTLWHTGVVTAVHPAYYRFVRVSRKP